MLDKLKQLRDQFETEKEAWLYDEDEIGYWLGTFRPTVSNEETKEDPNEDSKTDSTENKYDDNDDCNPYKQNDFITIKIDDRTFGTYRYTLTQVKDSKLAKLFNGECVDKELVNCDKSNLYSLNYNSDTFAQILDVLRNKFIMPKDFELTATLKAALSQFGLLNAYNSPPSPPNFKRNQYDYGDAYKNAMITLAESTYGQYCSIEGLSARSAFKQHQNDTVDPQSANTKKIMKEIRKDLAKNVFLSYNDGSMFIRFDESNPRFLQAMLIGLKDTPYFNGCFLFDIYLSNDYPVKAPKVKHTTNGANKPTANNGPGGFSPNLHKSTGKVCLSLLGTWSGPGWQANKSNVYQILSTLLLMVFGAKHPYYMEPDYGGWEGTITDDQEHDPEVIEYDEELLYHTAKWTILEILKTPYAGFEDVIKTHFKIKRKQIIKHMDEIMNNGDYSTAFKNKIKPIHEQIQQQLWVL